jgi:hypothetical protein
MFVEYQPSTPSNRAFKPGAMTVLISVCPVFRSLPAIGDLVSLDSCSNAGTSALRFGAPLAYGMLSLMAAYAYTMLDGIDGSLASRPFSNASMLACAGDSVR